ncbi:histidine kinase [Leptolyngbya ohadii]|uniref:histidine kinase n=1 Tax=Leptolyngbya ohadii TaxID=1962290 RepID=UPI000B59BCC7|nr:histidine kinase [Leptolyngbya ohadii]
MKAQPSQISSEAPLQLLLFVDKRPSSGERIRQVRNCLKTLAAEHSREPYTLQVVDVSEQPHLAEHFKLVATPSLIKIHPEPQQILAGSNLVAQIEDWWSRWLRSVDDFLEASRLAEIQDSNGQGSNGQDSNRAEQIRSIEESAELLKLSDEIFRLQREKEELQAQLQFKDQLIAMLAHDLRNPLTAVSIALETLEMGSTPKSDGGFRLNPDLFAQLIRHARTQTKALDRMITDILQAARERNSEFRMQPQKLDLGQLCQEAIEHLGDRIETKSQQISTDIPSDLPHVYADVERVRQVVVNLLDNAIKYTPEGGAISVAILHRTTQKVQVSICDNGPGIPPENQKHIFEDRFRLQRDEGKDGYGIGLALCRRIVQAHYGQIWVDSNEEQGSCFHFTLPVYRLTPSP